MYPFVPPLDKACKIIEYHPAGLWAIDKADGVLSHPNRKGLNSRCILLCDFNFNEECYTWSDKEGKSHRLFLLHRLDSATSGIILLSSDRELAIQVKKSFLQRKVEKTYFSVVDYKGKPVKPTWKDYLLKKSSDGQLRVISSKNGSVAITQASLERKKLSTLGTLALLKLIPKTGRTHQLRVQSALRKMPIIGDRTYGNFQLNRKLAKLSGCQRLFLHAAKIKVQFGLNEKRLNTWEVESPLPHSFEKILA